MSSVPVPKVPGPENGENWVPVPVPKVSVRVPKYPFGTKVPVWYPYQRYRYQKSGKLGTDTDYFGTDTGTVWVPIRVPCTKCSFHSCNTIEYYYFYFQYILIVPSLVNLSMLRFFIV